MNLMNTKVPPALQELRHIVCFWQADGAQGKGNTYKFKKKSINY